MYAYTESPSSFLQIHKCDFLISFLYKWRESYKYVPLLKIRELRWIDINIFCERVNDKNDP